MLRRIPPRIAALTEIWQQSVRVMPAGMAGALVEIDGKRFDRACRQAGIPMRHWPLIEEFVHAIHAEHERCKDKSTIVFDDKDLAALELTDGYDTA